MVDSALPPASARPAAPSGAEPALTISCADCSMRSSPACEDCVVTFLCSTVSSHGRGAPDVTLDDAELHTMQLLRRARLVPAVRHPRHLHAVG